MSILPLLRFIISMKRITIIELIYILVQTQDVIIPIRVLIFLEYEL